MGLLYRKGGRVASAPPSYVFQSNFANSTGTGASAILDGTTWSRAAGDNHEVVTAASCGFDAVVPSYTGNVYRTEFRGREGGAQVQQDAAYPESTSHYGRLFFKTTAPDRNDHGVVYNGIRNGLTPDVNVFQINNMRRLSGGTDQWRLGVGHLFPYPFGVMFSPLLDNDTWYRYEWHVEFATATTMRVWPRVYVGNSSTILYDAADFDNALEGSTYSTLLDYFDTEGANRYSSLGILNGDDSDANAVAARRFAIGDEGPNSDDPGAGTYQWFAGIAISTSDWVGPY